MQGKVNPSAFSARRDIRMIEKKDNTGLSPNDLRDNIFLAIRMLLESEEEKRNIADAASMLKEWCKSYYYRENLSSLVDLIIAEDREMNAYD